MCSYNIIKFNKTIMLDKILYLSKQFISIKSFSGNPKALEEVLELALLNLKEFTIEKFSKNGINSALIYNRKIRPKKFKIILNGHLDVIPGKKHQYKHRIINDKLYGTGSMDMKSNVACLIMSFKEVAKKINYPIALQLVTDEQTGSLNGTKYQVDKGVRADFIIAGETTNFNIVNKAKGVLWIKISTKGKTSHGAYPWQGKNSIWEMNTFLNHLKKKYPIPNNEVSKTTVNLSRIETSNASFNKVPDDCVIWLDIRYIPEEKNKIIKYIKNLLPKGFNLNIFFEEPPLLVDNENIYLKTLQNITSQTLKKKVLLYTAHGTSDMTYYTKVNCPGVEFGPIGVIGNTNNEYIYIPSLKIYYQIITKFLLSLNYNLE